MLSIIITKKNYRFSSVLIFIFNFRDWKPDWATCSFQKKIICTIHSFALPKWPKSILFDVHTPQPPSIGTFSGETKQQIWYRNDWPSNIYTLGCSDILSESAVGQVESMCMPDRHVASKKKINIAKRFDIYGSMLLKIRVIDKNALNKSCWALKSIQKSQWAHMFMYPKSRAKGLQRVLPLHK